MKTKDTKIYTVQCYWTDDDEPEMMFKTVAIGRPDFFDKDEEEWTYHDIRFDGQIFYNYEDYAELNQHLKDGDETNHDFIVTKIINQ